MIVIHSILPRDVVICCCCITNKIIKYNLEQRDDDDDVAESTTRFQILFNKAHKGRLQYTRVIQYFFQILMMNPDRGFLFG